MEYKKNCLMEIYTDNRDSFSVGFYLCSLDKYSLFYLLDNQGKSDGIYLIKNSFIDNVIYDTEYLKKINFYIKYWNMKSFKINFPILSKLENLTKLEDYLEFIRDENWVSSFKVSNEDYLVTGYIEDIDEFNIGIKTIDIETAKDFEKVKISLKDILILEVDSIENRLLDFAHNNYWY